MVKGNKIEKCKMVPLKSGFGFRSAFAAGAMIYVVAEELIPEANRGDHSNLATIGLAVGFVLMMVLDIALG
jgi:ZIP family zinc transporter